VARDALRVQGLIGAAAMESKELARIALLVGFLATLALSWLFEYRLNKKVFKGHPFFSRYSMSPMRLVDALGHTEAYLFMACVFLGFLIILLLIASGGCDGLSEMGWFGDACSALAPFWGR
jgi:hypothetical protein